jgi:hypothetical protein
MYGPPSLAVRSCWLLASSESGPDTKLDSDIISTAHLQRTPIENNTGNDSVRITKEAMVLQDRFPVPDRYMKVFSSVML